MPMPSQMQISPDGVDFICQPDVEGFRPKPYNDSANNSTIGFGTLLHFGPVDMQHNPLDQQYAAGISRDEAKLLMLAHLKAEVEPVIAQYVKVALNQCQYDALCSFIYQEGSKHFKDSTLLFKLNGGHYNDVPNEFRRWIYAGGKPSSGIRKRRELEISLWLKGTGSNPSLALGKGATG